MKLIQVKKTDEILEFLNQNRLINLNIIGKIENNSELPIFTDDSSNPTGVLVKSGYMHFLYTENDSFIDAVLEEHMQEGFFGFAGLEESIAHKIKARYVEHWCNPCTIYVYTQPSVELMNGDYDVRAVAYADAAIVDKYYEFRNERSIKAIQSDIKNRPSSAVYIDGEPVCWVLVHEDNSMGIMYTREEYRRKGLAEVVSRDLVQRIIAKGGTPYLQIIGRNTKSPGLAKKCGFTVAGRCEWFGIITGRPKELLDMAEKELSHFKSDYGHPRFRNSEEELELTYFLMPWIPENRDDAFTAHKLNDVDGLDHWTSLMKHSTCIEKPSESMDAWLIRYKGDVVGAALTCFLDDEDGYMHDYYIKPEYDQEQAMWALMQGIKNQDIHFIETLIPVSLSKQFKTMKFRSFGIWDR